MALALGKAATATAAINQAAAGAAEKAQPTTPAPADAAAPSKPLAGGDK